MTKQQDNMQGIFWIIAGMFIFSLQNIAIKWISGGYPIFQIVIIRCLMALPLTVILFRFEGGRGLPRTEQHRLEIIRGLLLFCSYTTYFMGLAAIPLAEAAAIRFSAPLIITFFSVTLMGESVGWRRWTALLVGFAGVLFIVRPGAANFNLGSLFMAVGTTLYALSTWLTRRLKEADSSATMAFYSTQVYLTAAFILTPIILWVGELPNAHPSIAFMFRPWAMPTTWDFMIMLGLGFVWAGGMYCMAKAYSLTLASVVAPFEYITLPINVMWGFVIWREIPTVGTWIGASLTLGSGLFIWFREYRLKQLNSEIA